MGYNSNCYYQDCRHDCCNYNGNCPLYSSDCYYYYDSSSTSYGWIIAVSVSIAAGLIVFFTILCICRCLRRKR